MTDTFIEYMLLWKFLFGLFVGLAGYYASEYFIKQKGKTNMFEKGDVVKLKSGGPEMTISQVKMDSVFEVVYFDQTGKLQISNFYGVCLFKVTNK
ncbi:hypothetical protein phiA047_0215 [Aeromonas phage phiA047]|nr:hypothetical protein phiA047_0215 [Aeromonas phage phiA047]